MSDSYISPDDPANPIRDTQGLPNTLRQWREHVSWTQDQLAAKSGVSQKTISAIENGNVPHDGTLMKLAEAFGYKIGMAPDAVFQDLVAAREHKPADTVSSFAKRLDNLLQGHTPAMRLFFEDMLLTYYLDMVKIYTRAVEHQKELRARKNPRSKPPAD